MFIRAVYLSNRKESQNWCAPWDVASSERVEYPMEGRFYHELGNSGQALPATAGIYPALRTIWRKVGFSKIQMSDSGLACIYNFSVNLLRRSRAVCSTSSVLQKAKRTRFVVGCSSLKKDERGIAATPTSVVNQRHTRQSCTSGQRPLQKQNKSKPKKKRKKKPTKKKENREKYVRFVLPWSSFNLMLETSATIKKDPCGLTGFKPASFNVSNKKSRFAWYLSRSCVKKPVFWA